MNSLKIVQWNSALCWGGAEIRLSEICENLNVRGHKIYLVCRKNSPLHKWAKIKNFIDIDCSAPANSGDLIRALMLGLRIRKWKADIIHVHAGKDYFPAVVSGIVANCPVVVHRHLINPINILTKWICEKWKVVFIGVSNAVVDVLKKSGIKESKIFYVPLGVDPRRISFIKSDIEKVRKELQIYENTRVILSVGHLYKSKGHDDLIKVVNRIRDKYPNVLLLIVGEGEMRQKLERLIKDLGVEKNVKLLGLRYDIPVLLEICEFFSLLSWEDPFPGAIIEALAAGKPVVACFAGGVPEIVKHNETGFLVKPHDVDSTVDFFDKLLSNKNLLQEMGMKAKKDFTDHLSIDKTIEKLEKIYDLIINI